ncbi:MULTISPECIES: DUF6894 family protein [Methylobacterium]|uniref:DUF6894 family protein n=1 Tax=Methylobacterium TaxID=407 RepID=UPI0010457FF1|nr:MULTISPECIES: hypothetical protein [Methylobacterium]MDR7038780.1 hypothetical protein [Methylobacterium sp. BE186]
MARYFFHLRTGRTFSRDDEGVEISDPDHVAAHAARLARRLIAETDLPGIWAGTWARSAFAVMDGEQRLILHLPFATVLGPRPLLH